MINMSKVNIDYSGKKIWVDNKRFVAKERIPQHFVKSNISKYSPSEDDLVRLKCKR